MTSRERIIETLNHREPDNTPLDLGSTPVTGMQVSSVYLLRQSLELDPPGTPVKVIEPFQMLGEIKPDLMDVLGVDVIGLGSETNMFGFKNENWKEWKLFDGIPVLVPEKFNTEPDENGNIPMYAQGDPSYPPCAVMPAGGYYFDAVNRQKPGDLQNPDPEDNLEEFTPVTDDDLKYYRQESERLFNSTGKAIIGNFGGTGFGDIALVPAMQLKDPGGIRGVEEWYMQTVADPSYVRRVFEKQCEIALDNLNRIHEAVGNRIQVVFITGTDFGSQNGPFIDPASYRDLYMPFHTMINDWVHRNTNWKTFIHSCGSVNAFIPDFIEAGFDILNPVQWYTRDMDPAMLKSNYGDRLTFWGGGINTQKTLPLGTPGEVAEEVKRNIEVFGAGGGFVFNTVHNVQSRVPVGNLMALYDTFSKYR